MNPHSAAAWAAGFFLASCLFSHTVAPRLSLLLLGAGFSAWTVLNERSSVHRIPPVWLAFALWAAWSALSIAWSADVARSVKEFHNEFLYTGLALWMCYVAAQAPNALRAIPSVVALAAGGACAAALYNYPQGDAAYAKGLHGGAGNHSSMLLALMPLAITAWWYAARTRAGRWVPAAAVALALLFVVSAYTTLNRTVWLGFAAELLIMLGLAVAARQRPWHVRTKIQLAVIAMVIPVTAIAMTWLVHGERVEKGAPAELKKDVRTVIWPEAFELVEERPWTGYGVGRGLLRDTLTKETHEGLAWHAHNLFLDTLLQTGAPGLALLCLLLASLLREAWRLARGPDPAAAACGIALAGIVVGMLVRNMTDVLWVRHNALLFWGVAGALLGWARSRTAAPAG